MVKELVNNLFKSFKIEGLFSNLTRKISLNAEARVNHFYIYIDLTSFNLFLMESEFICLKKDAVSRISRMKKLTKSTSKKSATIEIRVHPLYVTFHAVGFQEKLFCETKGVGAYTMSLEYFLQLLKDTQGEKIHPQFKDNGMYLGGLFSKGVGYKIQCTHPENAVTLDLPINYRDVDLLRLRGKVTDEELELTNDSTIIEAAEERLEKNIHEALKVLKEYGVTKEDLINLVEDRIPNRGEKLDPKKVKFLN